MNGNNGLNDIITKLTENPEMMKSLMNVAGNIMNNNGSANPDASFNGGDIPQQHTKKEECHVESQRGEYRKRGDDAENLMCLLLALKPYVSDSRCNKIDGIVKILKLVQLSEKTGLLKSLL